MNDSKGAHDASFRVEQETSPERFELLATTREEGEQLIQAFWSEYLALYGKRRYPEQSVFEALFGGAGQDWAQELTHGGDRTSLKETRGGDGYVVFIRGNRATLSERGLEIVKKLGYDS